MNHHFPGNSAGSNQGQKMKKMAELDLAEITGGAGLEGVLPLGDVSPGVSEAYIASILALLEPSRVVHHAD
jgi:hypothetical protein